ncbi:TPA: multidrug MFS transporter, partial [Streptococcus suis]|nr:multidrug MFS transporter [Streptococcus suis]
MIFVTVGTHEQQFNRLIKEIDLLKKNGSITDEIFI